LRGGAVLTSQRQDNGARLAFGFEAGKDARHALGERHRVLKVVQEGTQTVQQWCTGGVFARGHRVQRAKMLERCSGPVELWQELEGTCSGFRGLGLARLRRGGRFRLRGQLDV